MKIHNVQPSSPEWHALRARCRCASEAPVVMNASRHMPRQELVRIKALGLEKEFSDWAKKHLLEKGHEIEAAAREIVEGRIGEALYPAVVTDDEEVHLSSLDGMPMDEARLWECKSLNADLLAMVERAVVDDPHYFWQLEHQLMTVPHADEAMFTVSDGSNENTHTIIYKRVPGRREQLIAAWEQFDRDVAEYVHVEETPHAVGQKVKTTLPALVVELSGTVVQSNLDDFKEKMLAIIASVNTDLQTDQDFADAKEGAKFCEDIEARVKIAKEAALSKMASVDEAFKALDDISEAARQQRLKLDRLVKERDVTLKAEIVQNGKDAFAEHVKALNVRIGKPYMPTIATDFPGCIRNKRSFKNMRDAVAAHLADRKIEANRIADQIDTNLKMLREVAADYKFLFPEGEARQLVLKDVEACRAIVEGRINNHKAEEERKARERKEREEREAREAEERRQRAEAEAAARRQREAEAAAQSEQQLTGKMIGPGRFDDSGEFGTVSSDPPSPSKTMPQAPSPSSIGGNVRPLRAPASASTKPTRPDDDQIIEVLALHYRVHESKVIEWLLDMDLQAASDRMAAHI